MILFLVVILTVSFWTFYHWIHERHGFGWALSGALFGFMMICGMLAVTSVHPLEGTLVRAVGVIGFLIIYIPALIAIAIILDKEELHDTTTEELPSVRTSVDRH